VEAIVVEGHAAKGILKAAEDHDIDLILITIQSKGLIERALVGTSAEEIIREAQRPVLSIPAHVPVPYEQLSELHSAKP
jgi:nucleotide-binding universal stress UspA family protein